MLAAPLRNGIVFDIRKYSIHDGPGIRTTVFFKGCPLRCWWCHNPEGQDPGPELVYRESRCIHCGECVNSCQRGGISVRSNHVSVDRANCVSCGNCARVCPSDALSIAGRRMNVRAVLDEIERDRIFYEESGGGVTISGGEPLMQPDFLNALLKGCNARDIHTTVDTCGFAPYEIIDKIRGRVDLFLYDIKMMDTRRHRKYAGVSNERILRNLKRLAENGSGIVISFPLVPGINDDDGNVTRTAKFVSSLPNVRQVSLLPYHRGGIEKYRSLGKPYRLDEIQPPSDENVKSVKERIEAFGMNVTVGGG
jgi:pyruvate formate lyase activating enzyme